MKAKNLWLVLITLVFFGCDDNTGGLGMGMLPGSDGITIGTKKFDVTTRSEHFDDYAVFAKTNIGYVGQFTDNEHGFGYYEGSFLTEFNCVDDLTFPKAYDPVTNRDSLSNMISDDVDKSFALARIVLGYYSFFGDSINPMQVSIYELENNLKKDHYTNIDPSKYSTKAKLLGRKSFSAVDYADSTRLEANHLHTVSIPVTDELGKRIMKKFQENAGYFQNSETFINNVLKGIYITSEIGDGTVLYINHVGLDVVYHSYQLDSNGDIQQKYNPATGKHDSGEDSTFLAARSFASTMEVIQANQIKISEDEINKKVTETAHTYLKSPAGIYTRAILPIGEIMNKDKNGVDLEQDTINSVKLVFNAYHHDTTTEYSMSPPASVLLIKESEVKDFFEKNEIPNNTTSYVAYYSNNKYTFTNIMRLITSLAKEMEEEKAEKGSAWDEKEWLDENAIAIIPVTLGTSTSSSSTTITNVRHDMKPAYVKLKGGDPNATDPNERGSALDLEVVYSRFNQ